MDGLKYLEAEDVAGFNAARTERSRPELFASDLEGKQLVGIDLAMAQMDKSDLTGANLTDACLTKASLCEIDGSGMNLSHASAVKLKLRGAYMDGADLSEADLAKADLTEAHLPGVSAVGVSLMSSRMREANAAGGDFSDGDLSEASMHEAVFKDCTMSRVELSGARGNKAVFAGAMMDGAVGREASFPEGDFSEARLLGSRWIGAELRGANFAGADLTAADLSRADLAGANFAGACLRGVCLAEASIEGADFTDADLTDGDLSGLDPAAAGLSEAQCEALDRWGFEVDADAPMHPIAVDMAAHGGGARAVWINQDSELERSLRWCEVAPGAEARRGFVQVSGNLVKTAHMVEVGDATQLVVVKELAGELVVAVFVWSAAGPVLRYTVPLGYTPMVRPVCVATGDDVYLYGIGSRGPAVIIQRLSPEGLEPLLVQRQPTAVRFAGRHAPVLSCKGGVMFPISDAGLGKPMTVPSEYGGVVSVALPEAGRLRLVWGTAGAEPGDGVLETALLGQRGRPAVDRLVTEAQVMCLDARTIAGATHVVWVESDGETHSVRGLGLQGFVDYTALSGVVDVRFGGGGHAETGVIVGLHEDGSLTFVTDTGELLGRVS